MKIQSCKNLEECVMELYSVNYLIFLDKLKIKNKEEKKPIPAPKKKSIKRKKFALFSSFTDQPMSLQN